MIKDLWHKNTVVYCLSVGTAVNPAFGSSGDFVEFACEL
jgi:hypothetical protein